MIQYLLFLACVAATLCVLWIAVSLVEVVNHELSNWRVRRQWAREAEEHKRAEQRGRQ